MRKSKELSFAGQEVYVGIDVHKKSWTVAIYCGEQYHKSFNQDPKVSHLAGYLRRTFPRGNYHAAYEAGFSGYWISRQLQSEGIDCQIVHPADVGTTDKERRRKNDRVDAHKLARELKNASLTGIYIPEPAVVQARDLVRQQGRIVKEITRLKNQIKSLLDFHGYLLPEEYSKSSYWSRSMLRYIEALDFNTEAGEQTKASLLRRFYFHREEKLRVDRQVIALSRSVVYAEAMQLICSLPGISRRSAMVWLTELVDIHRFRDRNHLCSYIGLAPGSRSSGEKEISTGLDHRGNKYLRSILIENAWKAIQVDPQLMKNYLDLKKSMTGHKAIIRIARQLLTRLRSVWLRGSEYQVI